MVPGGHGDDQSDAALNEQSRLIGFPVMIRATAGGGGRACAPSPRWMRCRRHWQRRAARAEAAFGDGRLLLEKLVTRPRHIEVQVLGDKHGHLVHLFERDCSVQRHHQKLLEEAPAPNLSDATRAALHRHAVKLATAIGYDPVGTMEFIVDAVTEEFFFLEMNTRLQVEQTVTEEITGLDLVEWQLRSPQGEPLPFSSKTTSTATGTRSSARHGRARRQGFQTRYRTDRIVVTAARHSHRQRRGDRDRDRSPL